MLKMHKNLPCGAIIIVRLKSKRLENKALLKIDKKNSIIEYLIIKLKKIFEDKNIVLATSHKSKDKKLISIAKKKNINFFQGEAIDVLKRIYLSARKNNFTNVFISTADNPMIDIILAKKMIRYHIKYKKDFTSAYQMPLGTYGWVLKVSSIKKILLKKKRKDTEIWGDFFLKNKKMKCTEFMYKSKKKVPFKMRLTVDTKEDLKLVKFILKISSKKFPNLNQIEDIMLKNEQIFRTNLKIKQKAKPKKIY